MDDGPASPPATTEIARDGLAKGEAWCPEYQYNANNVR